MTLCVLVLQLCLRRDFQALCLGTAVMLRLDFQAPRLATALVAMISLALGVWTLLSDDLSSVFLDSLHISKGVGGKRQEF